MGDEKWGKHCICVYVCLCVCKYSTKFQKCHMQTENSIRSMCMSILDVCSYFYPASLAMDT